jgi:hypothetical protein
LTDVLERKKGTGIGSRIVRQPEHIRHGESKIFFALNGRELKIYPPPKKKSCISSWLNA